MVKKLRLVFKKDKKIDDGLDDVDSSMINEICRSCRFYHGRLTCKAFRRIPADIFWGRVIHDKPYPGDHGITYEKGDRISDEEADIMDGLGRQLFPPCEKCKHYLGGIECEAFEEIPDEILEGTMIPLAAPAPDTKPRLTSSNK